MHLQFPTPPRAPGPGEQNAGRVLANTRASGQKEKPLFLWILIFFHSMALKKQTQGSLATALRAAMHFKAHSSIISRLGLRCHWGF